MFKLPSHLLLGSSINGLRIPDEYFENERLLSYDTRQNDFASSCQRCH